MANQAGNNWCVIAYDCDTITGFYTRSRKQRYWLDCWHGKAYYCLDLLPQTGRVRTAIAIGEKATPRLKANCKLCCLAKLITIKGIYDYLYQL